MTVFESPPPFYTHIDTHFDTIELSLENMQFLLATLVVVVQMVNANLGVTTESQLIKTVVNDTESTPPKPCLRAEFTASV